MNDRQWPLSAPATRLLLDLPAAGAKPRRMGKDTEPVKLALKELLVRGVFTMSMKKRRFGRDRVMLVPGDLTGPLPAPLARLRAALSPVVPGEIEDVLKRARERNPMLVVETGMSAHEELATRGLIEQHHVRRLKLFVTQAWSRTASGDAWTATAAQHLERLEGLEREFAGDPDSGMRIALAAGSMTVLVPSAMGAIEIERRRRRDSASGGEGIGGGEDEATDFNVFEGAGNLIDSGALDSAWGSIDGAIDSGVDAGGGDGGDGGGGD